MPNEEVPAKEFLYFQFSFEQMPLLSSWRLILSEILTKHYEEYTSIISLTLGKLAYIIIFIITFFLWLKDEKKIQRVKVSFPSQDENIHRVASKLLSSQ